MFWEILALQPLGEPYNYPISHFEGTEAPTRHPENKNSSLTQEADLCHNGTKQYNINQGEKLYMHNVLVHLPAKYVTVYTIHFYKQ